MYLKLLFLPLLGMLAGCATPFPRPADGAEAEGAASGEEIFAGCLAAHGGDLRKSVREVRLSTTGEWGTLIQRVQPLIADAGWRVEAEERHVPAEGRSEILYRGPEGTKRIVWDYPEIEVYYNGEPTTDPDIVASTAMTTAAFQLFHLGPSFLAWHGGTPVRLADETVDGKRYHRLHFVIQPGFGFSGKDEVVAYIDPETMRLFRVWITLEGFRTTQGATVDTTYLDYTEVEGFVLPSQFVERVRSPISLHVHAWEATEIDLVR